MQNTIILHQQEKILAIFDLSDYRKKTPEKPESKFRRYCAQSTRPKRASAATA